jgi:hypothetical protein
MLNNVGGRKAHRSSLAWVLAWNRWALVKDLGLIWEDGEELLVIEYIGVSHDSGASHRSSVQRLKVLQPWPSFVYRSDQSQIWIFFVHRLHSFFSLFEIEHSEKSVTQAFSPEGFSASSFASSPCFVTAILIAQRS